MYLSAESIGEMILTDIAMHPGVSRAKLVNDFSTFNSWLATTFDSNVDNLIKLFLDVGIIRYVSYERKPMYSDSLLISSKHLAYVLRMTKIKQNLHEIQMYDAKCRYDSIVQSDSMYRWEQSKKDV